MKILVVTSEIIADKYSASIRTVKIVNQLSKGNNLDLLTEPMSELNFDHQIENIYLTDIPTNITTKPKTFLEKSTLYFFQHDLRFRRRLIAFEKKIKTLDLDQYDFVLALGGGGFFEPLISIANQKTSALKIGFIHDPYPGFIFPEPYATSQTKFAKKEKIKLERCFHKLDKLAFPSLVLAEWMNKYYNFGEDKICLLPHLLPDRDNGLEIISKKTNTFLKQKLIKKNKFYLHTGTLLKHRQINDIIKQFKKAKINKVFPSDFKLVLIGNIRYDIQDSDEDVVIINKRMPHKTVIEISKLAKSLMIIEHVGKISPFLPGKFPEYLIMEKPIMHFGPKNSEVCRLGNKFLNEIRFSAPLDDENLIYNLLVNGGVKFELNKETLRYFSTDDFLTRIQLTINKS